MEINSPIEEEESKTPKPDPADLQVKASTSSTVLYVDGCFKYHQEHCWARKQLKRLAVLFAIAVASVSSAVAMDQYSRKAVMRETVREVIREELMRFQLHGSKTVDKKEAVVSSTHDNQVLDSRSPSGDERNN